LWLFIGDKPRTEDGKYLSFYEIEIRDSSDNTLAATRGLDSRAGQEPIEMSSLLHANNDVHYCMDGSTTGNYCGTLPSPENWIRRDWSTFDELVPILDEAKLSQTRKFEGAYVFFVMWAPDSEQHPLYEDNPEHKLALFFALVMGFISPLGVPIWYVGERSLARSEATSHSNTRSPPRGPFEHPYLASELFEHPQGQPHGIFECSASRSVCRHLVWSFSERANRTLAASP